MAHSRTEQGTKVIHLVLNEQEAEFLRDVTQNCLLSDGGMYPQDMIEPTIERRARLSIFEELNKQLSKR